MGIELDPRRRAGMTVSSRGLYSFRVQLPLTISLAVASCLWKFYISIVVSCRSEFGSIFIHRIDRKYMKQRKSVTRPCVLSQILFLAFFFIYQSQLTMLRTKYRIGVYWSIDYHSATRGRKIIAIFEIWSTHTQHRVKPATMLLPTKSTKVIQDFLDDYKMTRDFCVIIHW